MTKIVLVASLIGISLTTNNQLIAQSDNSDKTIAQHRLTSSYNVAIFPKSYPAIPRFESFTPTLDQVDLAERALSRDLRSLNRELRNQTDDYIIHQRLGRYNRQYFGYINKAGEKVLLIKAFWRMEDRNSNENNWFNEMVRPTQTGGLSWSIEYNLDRNMLYDFFVPSPPKAEVIQEEEVLDEKTDASN